MSESSQRVGSGREEEAYEDGKDRRAFFVRRRGKVIGGCTEEGKNNGG
jgi:hypothetical protein